MTTSSTLLLKKLSKAFLEEFPPHRSVLQGLKWEKIYYGDSELLGYQKDIIAIEMLENKVAATVLAGYLGLEANTLRHWKSRFQKKGKLHDK